MAHLEPIAGCVILTAIVSLWACEAHPSLARLSQLQEDVSCQSHEGFCTPSKLLGALDVPFPGHAERSAMWHTIGQRVTRLLGVVHPRAFYYAFVAGRRQDLHPSA